MKNINRTLHKKPIYIVPMLLGTVITLVFSVLGGMVALFDESVLEEARKSALVLFAGTPLFFSFWGIYEIKNILCFRCFLEPDRIGLRTTFKVKWFNLSEITSITWKPNLKVDLKTAQNKKRIHLQGLPINQKRHLILYLRRKVAPKLHIQWEEYGEPVAYRMLRSFKNPKKQNGQFRIPGSRIVVRSRYLLKWGVFLFFSILCTAFICWLTIEWPDKFPSWEPLALITILLIKYGSYFYLVSQEKKNKNKTLEAREREWEQLKFKYGI